MILHLGIIDVPYDIASFGNATKRRRLGKAKRGKADAPPINRATGQDAKTTGDVAEILEAKYHVYETFFEDVGAEVIAGVLEHSMAGALENIAAGANIKKIKVTAEAESEIETAFKLFLGQQEMNGVVPGVPTKAALKGVNHRMLHPYAKRGPRSSFIDTGLYQANFKVWMTD